MKIRNLMLALALLAVPAAFSQNLPDLGDESQRLLSPLQELQLGREIMREIRADPSYSDDPEVVDYLNALGRRLAMASPDPNQQFDFNLLIDPQINAFSLPGGFVCVNSGLIMTAQNESELAGVLGHEMGHVEQRHFARQMAEQQRGQILSLATMAAALLASRANPDLAQAGIMGSQAGFVQSQLSYSRDKEREADRVGFQTMVGAGFDPQGMASFFQRLQQATRLEDDAPVYLRTHPLTYERIADMQNRAQSVPYRQVPDSLEFQLVRAKLKAEIGDAKDNVAFFEQSLSEKRYLNEAASRYGLAASLVIAKNYDRAKQEIQTLRKLLPGNPMVADLAAQIYDESGDTNTAQQIYHDTLQAYPNYRALTYDYADVLLKHNQPAAALKLVEKRLQLAPSDYHLYQLQARSYAALDKHLLEHRAQAEADFRLGDIKASIEQLRLAQRSGDGDFYQMAGVEARLKELQALLPPEDDDRKDRQGRH
ncbi:MAG TPA: M48 family metalloprotease [Burkholderiales bacterium]|nr:M48 family metalloprotease [Burkholderiales bacterium]